MTDNNIDINSRVDVTPINRLIGSVNQLSENLRGLTADAARVNLNRLHRDLDQIDNEADEAAASLGRLDARLVSTGENAGRATRIFTRNAEEARKLGRVYRDGSKTFKDFFKSYKSLNMAMKDDRLIGTYANEWKNIEDGVARGDNALGDFQKRTLKNRFVAKSFESIAFNLKGVGQNARFVGKSLTTSVALPLALGIQTSLNAYKQLDKELTRIAKVYGDTSARTLKDTEKIKEAGKKAAFEIGHEFAISRDVVAAVMSDVAAAGFQFDVGAGGDPTSSGPLASLTKEIARASTLGEIDLSVAKDQVMSLFSVFAQAPDAAGHFKTLGEQVKYTSSIINQFNQIENATLIQMSEIASAFPEVAHSAKQFNMSAAQTVSVLAAMRKAGLAADESATALKFSFARLQNPPKETTEKLREMGIVLENVLFDSEKNARPGIAVMYELANAIEGAGLTAQERGVALSELFGNRQVNRLSAALSGVRQGWEEIRAEMQRVAETGGKMKGPDQFSSEFAKAMVASGEFGFMEEGAAGFLKLQEAAKGAGEEAARAKATLEMLEKNAAGEIAAIQSSPSFKLEQAKQKWKELVSEFGKVIAPTAIAFFDKLNELLDKFNNLSDTTKKIILGAVIAFAALGPALMVASVLIESFAVVLGVGAKTFLFFARNSSVVNSAMVAAAGSVDNLGRAMADKNVILAKVGDMLIAVKNKTLGAIGIQEAEAAAHRNTARAIEEETEELRQNAALRATNRYSWVPGAGMNGEGSWRDNRTGHFANREQVAQRFADQHNGGVRWNENARRWTAPSGQGRRRRFISAEMATELIAEYMAVHGGVGDGPGPVNDDIIPGRRRGKAGKAFDMLGNIPGMKGIGKFLVKPFEILSKILPKLKLSNILNILKVGGKATGWGAVIIAAITLIVSGFKSLKANWKAFYDKAEPGITKLKKAFKQVWDALKKIGEPFKRLKGLSQAGGEAEGAWENVGSIISGVATVIAWIIEHVVPAIVQIVSVIQKVGDAIVDIVYFVVNIFKMEWKEAGNYLLSVLNNIVFAILHLFELILDASIEVAKLFPKILIGAFRKVINALPLPDSWKDKWNKNMDSVFSSIDKFTKTDWSGKGKKWMDEFLGVSDLRSRNEKVKSPKVDPDSANDAGNDAGAAIAEGIEEELNDSDIDAGELLSALKSRLDQQVNAIKEQALKMFDAMADARIAAIDAEIQAIEDVEEAEEKLQKAREYQARRAEMLKRRAIDAENYLRDRALAIYEGRIDDARMLDLEESVNKEDHNKELADLDEDRRKDLVDEERDAQKERLNAQKDGLRKILDAQREALEDQLDLLTEYTPKNVAEYANMISQVEELLRGAGVELASLGANAGSNFALAYNQAVKDQIDDRFWSGETGAAASPTGANTSSGGGGGGTSGGGSSALSVDVKNALTGEVTKITQGQTKEIMDLQKMLVSLGYDPGPIDGVLGPKTINALNQHQNQPWSVGTASYVDLAKLELTPLGWQTMINEGGNGLFSKFFNALKFFSAIAMTEVGGGDFGGGGGGSMRQFHSGGLVGGRGEVPALLEAGEFVINKDMVRKLGRGALEKLNAGMIGSGKVPNFGLALRSFALPAIASSVAKAATSSSGDGGVNIYVDTFVGERQWFEKMMKEYDVHVKPAKNRANGAEARKITSI